MVCAALHELHELSLLVVEVRAGEERGGAGDGVERRPGGGEEGAGGCRPGGDVCFSQAA